MQAVRYKGPMDVVKHVMRNEGGVVGLYKGMGATLLREVPGNAAMFGAYEWLKINLAKQQVRTNIMHTKAICSQYLHCPAGVSFIMRVKTCFGNACGQNCLCLQQLQYWIATASLASLG